MDFTLKPMEKEVRFDPMHELTGLFPVFFVYHRAWRDCRLIDESDSIGPPVSGFFGSKTRSTGFYAMATHTLANRRRL